MGVAVRRIFWVLRFVAIGLAGALLMAGLAIAVAPRIWGIANAHDQVPIALPGFEPLAQRSYVYDANDNEIAIFEKENIQPFTLDQVPENVIKAVLAVEDTEFYEHDGVNVRSLVRATLSNFSAGANRQGASTITQQVVKNEFLAGLPRNGRYKALQAHYATMLEKKISKDEILERYLNTVYFGNNAYGLQAAAEVYFGKSVEELTMIEGGFLAGLVRSPSGYDPIRNVEQSHRRFVQVLERLRAVDLLTDVERTDLEANWPLPYRLRTTPTLTSTDDTYYSLALREYLLTKSNILGPTEQERATLLFRGGLRIHTTLDPFMQAQAETARNILPPNSVGFDAAIVGLDTTTGAIRTMVGGRGLRSDEPAGEVNMALVPRQTGSSIKAFILAAAFEAGAQTNDVINGFKPCTVPDFKDGRETTKTVNSGYGEIGPLNGPNIWNSTDCGFVRLSYAVGLHRVVDSTYRMAHSTYFYQGQPEAERESFKPLGLTATGNNAMAPIDMAAGMQTITNQGLHHDPYYVEYVDRVEGGRFYTHVDPGTQVLDANAADATVLSLKGVLRSGTARRSLAGFSRPATGKTGTQFENTNAWFVGGTPQITTAVWVGDPNGYTPMVDIPEFKELGRRTVQGADYPAKIWGAFMEAAHTNLPVLDWPPPAAPSRPAARIYVPGEECLARLVSGTLPYIGPPTTVAATSSTAPTTTLPGDTTPPVTTAPVAVLQAVDPGTTVPLNVLDPRAPMPSVDLKTFVYPCAQVPPNDSVKPPRR